MVHLQQAVEDFQSARIQPVLILMGTPLQISPFVEKYSLSIPVLCDPDQTAYQAFDIPIGKPSQYAGPRIWLPALKAMFRVGMGKPVGNVAQMHGTVLVSTEGIIRAKFTARNAADYTTLEDLRQT